MAQWAENVYFGKPCGLMDQLASSTGGLVFMDFRDPAAPEVRRLNAALPGYALCIVDSGADHADLTAQYAAIPRDLKAVCRLFDAEVLRQVDEDAFYRRLPEVRRLAGDRAVLRAIHVFDENRRVLAQVRALESGDVPGFLSLINASGASSWEYLQNIAPAGAAEHQALWLCAAVCCGARVLSGSTAAASPERRCVSFRRRSCPLSAGNWRRIWPPAAATVCRFGDPFPDKKKPAARAAGFQFIRRP